MIDERLEEQASLYVLGVLSAGETREFETTLRNDAELRELIAKLATVTEAFVGTVPCVEPLPALKQRILAQIEQREKIVPLPSPSKAASFKEPVVWLPWTLAACLAVFCAVLASRENEMRARLEEMNRMAATLQSATNDLQHTIMALQETNRVANLRIAMLGSLLADQPKAVAVSVWDEQDQKGVFVVENMKPLSQDKDYQLWVIDPQYGTPVDAGVFQVDDKGKVRFQFKTKLRIKTADKFAVTQEVKGGVPVPTMSNMVLIGG